MWLRAIFTVLLSSGTVLGITYSIGGSPMRKPIDELRVRITSSTQVPEPTNIQATGDWYYLDHLSSGLVFYDIGKKTFSPMLAESWSERSDGTHVFKIRPGIRFHDGTPITARDIVWSIKRHLILKKSTHFPLWEYLVGCGHLKTLEDDCPGLQVTAQNEIIFKLKAQTDSFFLQLASPETGIWSAGDMDWRTARLVPTKFSGPYFLDSRSDTFALLKRNSNSIVSERFPNSPRSIRIKIIPLPQLDAAIASNEVDLVIKQYAPLGETAWNADKVHVHKTTPSSIIYLFGLGTGTRPPIGRDFVETLWRENRDPVITSSESFLPFAAKYGLKREEFLGELAKETSKRLRILCPQGFFASAFLDQIQRAAKSVGTEIEFSFAAQAEFFAAFNDPKTAERFDYILSIYAASERYPAVQLRYLTKALTKPPIDLKVAESPDHTEDRAAIFREYERWLLRSRQAIPLYFDVTLFVHQANIDIGEQSKSDAEIELWRVEERGK